MQPPEDRAAAARADWPIRVRQLGDEQDTTPEQRIGRMWELVVQAWAVAGIPIPDYERHEMPVRITRLQDQS